MAMEGLSVICGGLGIIEEDEDGNRIGYSKGEYCLDNLKDLLRFLRRDDPQTREVFMQVCKWNTVGKDVIPIIEHCQDDRNIVLNAVKVLVFLTMPVEPTSNDIPQQIECLWGLKSSITCSNAVTVIVSLLEGPLENLEGEVFTEDDWKLVQLVITLFRNILAVQDISLQQKVGGSASEFLFLRDRFLELMFQENVMDLILVLTQHVGGSCGYFRQDNLLLLETFCYIFRGQDPELIAKAFVMGPKVEGDAEASLDSLVSIMEEEKEKRKRRRLHTLSSNSQFKGTFTRLTVDGSKVVCQGNPCSREVLLKAHKGHTGPSKRILWDNGRMPSANDRILEMLHNFAKQFLSSGYNVLMQSVREDIEKDHRDIQNSDVVLFFQPSIKGNISEAFVNQDSDSTFFKGNICGPVAATVNESMFLLVISKWRNAFDGLKETNDFKFLSAAGSLMKIMIRMLDLVLKQSPEDSREPQTARVLLYKLFYDQTEQGMTQFLLNLIKSFDTHKQAKSDFADLVETMHVVIRLMETLQSRGTLRVSRKSRKKRKKKMPTTEKKDPSEVDGDHLTVQNEVGVYGCEKSVDISEEVKETPSDRSSDKIGAEDTIIPSEVDGLKASELEPENPGGNVPEMEYRKSGAVNNAYESEVSSDDEQLVVTDEVDFKVSTLVSALANNSIIHNLCWLLKYYKSNSIRTNHYIVCMLRRICEDLELSPMLYQLSLLTTFHSILDEQTSNPSKEYENIVVFLKSLVRGMLKKMKSNPLLFVEVLFWKTRKECHYINCESMLQDLGKLKKECSTWGNSSQDDEIVSSERNAWVRRSIADALGDDEADVVIPQGIDDQNEENPYSPKFQKDLKRRNLSSEEGAESNISKSNQVSDGSEDFINEKHPVGHGSKRVYKRMKPFVLNTELEEEIKDLYEKYKESQNCSYLIAEALNPDEVSPALISELLKQLGLKLPSRKRIRTNGSSNHGSQESTMGMEVNHLNSQNFGANSSSSQSLHTRKRVRAFNEDQETMIKALYEQFKDQKKCTSMIASALDGNGKFTAQQVSRKLKQLGLRIPKQKVSDANMHLRDEDVDDLPAEDAGSSDNETLSLLRKRSKTMQKVEKSNGRANQKSVMLPEDDSVDELLSSALGKSKSFLPKTQDDKLPSTLVMQKVTENGYGYQDTQDIILRDARERSEMKAGGTESLNDYDSDGEAEAGDVNVSNEQHEDPAIVDKVNNMESQQLNNELADKLTDPGDHITPSESQKVATSRRKLRMVIDPDEED